MTLRDPRDAALWASGEPRSQGNAFDTKYTPSGRLNMTREATAQKVSLIASRRVQAQKELGRDLSVGRLKLKTVGFDRPENMRKAGR